MYKYIRNAYTILDLLRDIGGLFGALNAIFFALIVLLNSGGLYQWLTSKLFRVQLMPDFQMGQNRRVHNSAIMEKFGMRIRDSIGKDIDKQLGIQ